MCARISNIRAIVQYNGRHPWIFCFFLVNLRTAKTRLVFRERAFVSARAKRERTKGCITGIEIGAKSRGFLRKSSTISGFHRLLDGRECRWLNNSWAFVARWIPTKYLVKHTIQNIYKNVIYPRSIRARVLPGEQNSRLFIARSRSISREGISQGVKNILGYKIDALLADFRVRIKYEYVRYRRNTYRQRGGEKPASEIGDPRSGHLTGWLRTRLYQPEPRERVASIVLFHVNDTAFGKCLRHARGETVYSLQGSRSFSLSLSSFPRRARARARIPLRPLRPPRRPHREGVAWLARQPALAHRNLSSARSYTLPSWER